MTYALAIVDKEEPKRPWPDDMRFYVHEMPTDAGVTRLNEGAWLLNLDTELLTLSQIVNTARKSKCPVQVLFFDQKPDFSSVLVEQKA